MRFSNRFLPLLFAFIFWTGASFAQKDIVVNGLINAWQTSNATGYPTKVGLGFHYRQNVNKHFQLGLGADLITQKRTHLINISAAVQERGIQRLVVFPVTFQSAYFLKPAEHFRPYVSADVGFYFMQTKLISKYRAFRPELKPRLGIAPGLGFQYMIDESIGFNFCTKYHLINASGGAYKSLTFYAGVVLNFDGYM